MQKPSPDGKHQAVFSFGGEIRFGPCWYHLRVDDVDFGKRKFGEDCLWTPDSKKLVVVEWFSTSEREGPRMRIVIVTPQALLWRARRVGPIETSVITPARFSTDLRRVYYTLGGSGDPEYSGAHLARPIQHVRFR